MVEGSVPGGPLYAPTVVLNHLDEAFEYAYSPVAGENEAARETFPTVCKASERAHAQFRARRRMGRNAALAHQIRQALVRTDRALKSIGREEKGRRSPEELRKWGELLLSRAHEVKSGEKIVHFIY